MPKSTARIQAGEFSVGRCGWLLTELGFVQLCEFLGSRRITLETLRLGAIVFIAPVSLILELGGSCAAAQTAILFRNAVLGVVASH